MFSQHQGQPEQGPEYPPGQFLHPGVPPPPPNHLQPIPQMQHQQYILPSQPQTQPQLQQQQQQKYILPAPPPPFNNDGPPTQAVPEVNTTKSQHQQMWYWLEFLKPFTFHHCCLSLPQAEQIATAYLSKLPTPNNTLEPAHASISLTFMHHSFLFQRYLILGILFPLLRRWTSTPHFHAFVSSPKYTYAPNQRTHRLSYWRQKVMSEPDALTRYLELLDTILDRKWVYDITVGDGGEMDMRVRAARVKMQAYFLWKFILSADVVFVELVSRLSAEGYNRERFHDVYYPNLIPKFVAINHDPYILPYIVAPPQWPSNTHIDEVVMDRGVAIMGRNIE